MNEHMRIEGHEELTYNDKRLLDDVIENQNKLYVVIDNDAIWVVDKELEEQEADDITYGTFDRFGYEFVMAMMEYLGVKAEYC